MEAIVLELGSTAPVKVIVVSEEQHPEAAVA
jgi:hypothetical protein